MLLSPLSWTRYSGRLRKGRIPDRKHAQPFMCRNRFLMGIFVSSALVVVVMLSCSCRSSDETLFLAPELHSQLSGTSHDQEHQC